MRRSWSSVVWCLLVCSGTACGSGDDDGDTGGRVDGAADPVDGAADPPDSAPSDAETGDAAAELPCDGNGTGQVDGTVGGQALDPVLSATFQLSPVFDKQLTHALFLGEDEHPDGCPPFDGPLEPNSGDLLRILICHEAEVGTYELVDVADYPPEPDQEDSCARLGTGTFNDPFGPGIVSGSITLETVGPYDVGCVVGHFSATFEGGDTLVGSFNALHCETK
jgi:hypothetical protein